MIIKFFYEALLDFKKLFSTSSVQCKTNAAYDNEVFVCLCCQHISCDNLERVDGK
jgi:hypothetical protein